MKLSGLCFCIWWSWRQLKVGLKTALMLDSTTNKSDPFPHLFPDLFGPTSSGIVDGFQSFGLLN
jgi:hypothetical protein